MKLLRISAVLVCGAFILACAQYTCLGQQSTNKPAIIKTNFVEGATLSDKEVKQVLELAKKCGIEDVSEVETFHYLPMGGKGIGVQSVKHVVGRSTTFESVEIHKDGWTDGFKPDTKAIRIGKFWAYPDAKYATLLRSYEFKKLAVQIRMGKDIGVELADKVIPLIAAKRVRFENEETRRDFETLADSIPTSISQSHFEKGYELFYKETSMGMRGLMFRFEKGEVIITGISHIEI